MKAGTAWRDFTPDHPIHLLGQMHARLGKYTRDKLTANAVVFEDQGRRTAIVSTDVCLIPNALAQDLRALIAADGYVKAEDVIVNATHTHVAPCTTNSIAGEVDPAWYESFQQAVRGAVSDAQTNLEEVTLWSGTGYLEHMGWNRRGMGRDGSCEMYRGSWSPQFKSIEGPRDGQVGVIWATRADGTPKLVISSFSTHPNCLEQGEFYSADIPGEVRQVLRGALGNDVGVIYLTGAAGDTAPSIMVDNPDNVQPWRNEAGVKRSGRYLGGEILKTIATTLMPMDSQTLSLAHRSLQIPMRPWDTAFEPEKMNEGGMKNFCMASKNDWDRLMKSENPLDILIHVIRLGDAAICFNPAELYCAFGLAIKKASPARATLIGELADGWCGYIPTPEAITHGGYSARSSVHTRCVPEAGWMIVENTTQMLQELF